MKFSDLTQEDEYGDSSIKLILGSAATIVIIYIVYLLGSLMFTNFFTFIIGCIIIFISSWSFILNSSPRY